MAVAEQDNLPEATPREAELQRRLDGLQSQVTDLFRAWEGAQNPEISPEVQNAEGQPDRHSEQCVSPGLLRWRSSGEAYNEKQCQMCIARFGTRRFFEVVMTPIGPRLHRGTVLRLPRQDYYRYLFEFRILPLGTWPQSSSYVIFYFYRKSLTGLEGAGVDVMTQVPGLHCFPPRSVLLQVLFTLVLWGPRCALGCTRVLVSFDSILRLAHTHSCFMSHTRFDSLWACNCGRATFVRVGQDRRSLET
ncbi:hypothetical protein DY000_02007599 [Brassica cretica]|uniref:Uncharacterized protein n=1 Tax=Brassica cretica TaxID=69181 RepID=A0ABQ7CFX8_BRACR|nr:hypothetical protein DY000_02007599 [Brassica cretica]